MQDDRGENDGQQDRRPEALAHHATNCLDVAPAARLRGERGDRAHDADTEQEEGHQEAVGQRACGQRLGAEPAHHDDVGRLQGVLGDLGDHQRPGQGEGGTEFAAPATQGWWDRRRRNGRRDVVAHCHFSHSRPML